MRAVIEEAVADLEHKTSEIVLVLHCAGCAHTEHRLPKRRRKMFAILGVSEDLRIEPEIVFKGDLGSRRKRAVSWLLRLSYLAGFVRWLRRGL